MVAIGGLIPLVVIGVIVYLIVRAFQGRERRDASPESTGKAVRRLFHYVLLFASLLIAAFGVIGLFGAILESDETVAGDASDLAVPLSLTIVGVPLFAGLAVWSRRRLAADPDEQRSIAWALYLSAALLASLIGSIVMLPEGLSWALGSSSTGGAAALAAACVWLAIWAAHWWVGERHGPLDELRTQRLVGSGIALWVGAGALIATASLAFSWVYDELFRTTIGSTISDDLRNVAPAAFVGAVAWWWYWLRHAVHDPRTGLWNAYALLVGVLPGLMITLTGAGIALFTTLEWAFGSPEEGASGQFSVIPIALSLVAVGAGVLFYHRGLVWRRHTEARAEIDRVYDYVVTAVGLLATGVALVMLIVAGIQAIVPEPIAEAGDSGVEALLLAITLFVVGAPLWWYFWSRVQRHAAADPVEVQSPSRRLYLFISFGIGGVAAVISLIVALAIALGDLLDGELSSDTLYQIRIPVALVLTIGAMAAYHWTVFREDLRRAPAEPERRHLRSVVVIGAAGDGLGPAILEATGTRPQIWPRLDRDNPTVDAATVIAAIGATEGERLMVVVDPSGKVEAFPVGSGR